jgi:flagellar basal-body rod modification protein FlgD
MSQVQSVNPATSSLTAPPSSSASSTQALEQQFLNLLVTQMQNQDPLNPIDNAQMTTQLAQLSAVTGIDQLNTTMQSLAASFSAAQTLQSATLIGHGVMVAGSQLNLSGGQAMFGATLAQPVDDLKVTITDSTGQVVHTADLGTQQAGTVALHWDGATDSGGVAADGSYSFSLTAISGGKPVSATTLTVKAVTGVSVGPSGARLNLSDGTTASLSDIAQII